MVRGYSFYHITAASSGELKKLKTYRYFSGIELGIVGESNYNLRISPKYNANFVNGLPEAYVRTELNYFLAYESLLYFIWREVY